MTVINQDLWQTLAPTQSALASLTMGAKLVARIVGSTRQGLVVQVGGSDLLLKTKSPLPEADHLTLQITRRAGAAARGIEVLAADGRLLAKPVAGELTSKAPLPAARAEPSSIAEGPKIDVDARPVAGDGKALGPPIAIRLATHVTAGAKAAHQPSSPALSPGPSGRAEPSRPVAERAGAPAPAGAPGTNPTSPLPPDMQDGAASPSPPRVSSSFSTVEAAATDGRSRSAAVTAANRPEPPTASHPAPGPSVPRPARDLMVATVVGREPGSGRILLRIDDGLMLKVDQPIDLPIGASLQITMPGNSAGLGHAWGRDGQPDRASPLTRLIELLDDIEKSGHTAGERSESSAARRLPMPDRDLAARLLHLFDLRGPPDIDGDGMTAARDPEGVSLSRSQQVQSLLSEIGNTASEPLADGWRSTVLPLGNDPAQAVMLHYREHNPDGEPRENETDPDDVVAQRAVFEVSFSRLGRCQIDALCQERRFDLLVRSERPLDHENQRAITAVFVAACEIAGLKGEIGYRQGQFVEPARASASTRSMTVG